MPTSVTLEWGNAHSLKLLWTKSQVHGTLRVEKHGGRQLIEFALRNGIQLNEVVEGWNTQGKAWDELFVHHYSGVFIAKRALWLPRRGCILWNVLHIDEAPFDTCDFTDLNKEIAEAAGLRQLKITA